MKIVIAGGSGQVGGILTRAWATPANELIILSRRHCSSRGARSVLWDGKTDGPWAKELEGADVLVNLAGRSVNCRYGRFNRREILESRVNSVHAIGRAITKMQNPPRLWLQAGTATIYAHRYDQPNDEKAGIIGGNEPNAPDTWRFSIDVATAWEAAFNQWQLPHTRKVILRSAITMSPDPGGAFSILFALTRLGLGGRAGNGRQFVSWIHETDFVRALEFLIANEDISGVVNICAPNPLPNADFMKELRRAAGVPFGLPALRWMLEIAAFFLRTETELLLKSRRVVPGRLLERGFEFVYPQWSAAARELCQRARRR